MLAARPIDGVWPCGSLEKASGPEAGRLGTARAVVGKKNLGILVQQRVIFLGMCGDF